MKPKKMGSMRGIKPGSAADRAMEKRMGIKPGSAADKAMERGHPGRKK